MTKLRADLKATETLEKLGLTSQQAKIYTTLCYSGKERILTISKVANIDRSNTYRTLLQLQNMGLVIRILGTPDFYEAVPFKDAISTLVNIKKSEYEKTQSIAQELVLAYSGLFSAPQSKEFEFRIVKKSKEPAKGAMMDTFQRLQKNNDFLINVKTITDGFGELSEKGLECMRRGIKFRVISEKITSKSILKELSYFISEPNFQIRYISEEPEPQIVINDRKLAKITLAPNSGITGEPILMTNHKGCVKIFQNHFDSLWKKAKEYNFDEIKKGQNKAISQ